MIKPIYMDYAAATPLSPEVLKVMQPYFSRDFYNPSASYLSAQAVKQDLNAARSTVAQVLGVKPAEIVFTAGATEANNLALVGVLSQFPGSNLIVSAIEHESILAPAKALKAKIAPVSREGLIDLPKFSQLIDDKTVLVSIMYANNEIGVIEPISEVAKIIVGIRKQRKVKGNTLPLYFHSDAAQAANYLDIHAHKLGVDMLSLNGGKIYGPKASGALFIDASVKLQPLILGGGQERGLRSGTENVPAIMGLAKALELTQALRLDETKRLRNLQQLFFALIAREIPEAIINGSIKNRLPNNIHLTLPGQDNERLIFALDEAGILAAAGSACSASKDEPSHVLKACGLSTDEARASLRFTMGRSTSEPDIHRVMDVFTRVLSH